MAVTEGRVGAAGLSLLSGEAQTAMLRLLLPSWGEFGNICSTRSAPPVQGLSEAKDHTFAYAWRLCDMAAR